MSLPLKFYVPLAVTFAAALVVLFTPASGVPSGFAHSDKIIHFVLFGVLAYTSRVAGIGLRLTAVWTLGFAVLSEILQAVLPLGRSGSIADALADAAGVAAGCAVAIRLPPHRSRVSTTLH